MTSQATSSCNHLFLYRECILYYFFISQYYCIDEKLVIDVLIIYESPKLTCFRLFDWYISFILMFTLSSLFLTVIFSSTIVIFQNAQKIS